MPKLKKPASPLFKVKSKVNSEIFYSSKDFPDKTIENKTFMGVKKTPTDKTLHYMLKENMVKVSNE